ncbi:tetratricopeptide repeat protein [Tenggerimyces flavus]|uniref:Tetratricopeptide repeat protein n=1 Tax=Tenggerimyces flavus TaxID=1708749 RepID=A0ABV7YIC7_9ACTN|nr:tetratricopeptide repeat protein [Tenggerimyces flavus]MBM7787446.1 tetratricopeptide (TPR) repeat protein [Tenggerimyces flavus]
MEQQRTGTGSPSTGQPGGDVYDWYRRGLDLLSRGEAAAAAQVLAHARAAEPASHSIREALARALFNCRQFAESAQTFEGLVEENPADDYAHFGLGLALSRMGQHQTAVGHLAIAAAMRPGAKPYSTALRQVRATLKAREAAE